MIPGESKGKTPLTGAPQPSRPSCASRMPARSSAPTRTPILRPSNRVRLNTVPSSSDGVGLHPALCRRLVLRGPDRRPRIAPCATQRWYRCQMDGGAASRDAGVRRTGEHARRGGRTRTPAEAVDACEEGRIRCRRHQRHPSLEPGGTIVDPAADCRRRIGAASPGSSDCHCDHARSGHARRSLTGPDGHPHARELLNESRRSTTSGCCVPTRPRCWW